MGIVSWVGPVQGMEAKMFDGQKEATLSKFYVFNRENSRDVLKEHLKE